MELYQRAMVNIMTRRASPQQIRDIISASPQASTDGDVPSSTSLTCPAGTPQNPNYLMVTALIEEHVSAKEPKRPKEQEASKFIAGNDNQLIIGVLVKHIIRKTYNRLAFKITFNMLGGREIAIMPCSYTCVLFQVVMGAMLCACRKTYKRATLSPVKHLRALHSARETSRSSPWKYGASRTPFPFLIVFLLSEIERTLLLNTEPVFLDTISVILIISLQIFAFFFCEMLSYGSFVN